VCLNEKVKCEKICYSQSKIFLFHTLIFTFIINMKINNFCCTNIEVKKRKLNCFFLQNEHVFFKKHHQNSIDEPLFQIIFHIWYLWFEIKEGIGINLKARLFHFLVFFFWVWFYIFNDKEFEFSGFDFLWALCLVTGWIVVGWGLGAGWMIF